MTGPTRATARPGRGRTARAGSGDKSADSDPRPTLDALRRSAQPGDFVVFGGEERALYAVYARLGHDPLVPTYVVPDQSNDFEVAEVARKRGARAVFAVGVELSALAGFAPAPLPESRFPATAPLRKFSLKSP